MYDEQAHTQHIRIS